MRSPWEQFCDDVEGPRGPSYSGWWLVVIGLVTVALAGWGLGWWS